MSVAPSSNPRRYLALWFPWLPSERLKRTPAGVTSPDVAPDDRPVVLVEKVGGALRLAAVDPAAAQAGLSAGMTLADAQARHPALNTIPSRPEADEALLAQVLDDFGRFSPMVALDPPHGLMLDITGCAHLFGDEVGLILSVQARAARIGLTVRLALADTPQAARALSRFGPGGRIEPGRTRAAVRPLPVAAMELSPKDELAFRRAGLKTLGHLDDRPRSPLAARFGADFPSRLARVLGDEDVRIRPHRPAPPLVADRVFFEPIAAPEDVERVLSDLLDEVVDRLDQAGQGGRAFEAGFYRVDGHVRRIAVRTGRPTRDRDAVLRLFREKTAALETPLDPGFGFDQLRMSVPWLQRLGAAQPGLTPQPAEDEAVESLVDRLTARLGPQAVLRFRAHGSHIPERAARPAPAAAPSPAEPWSDLDPDDPPLRPLQMFDPPQPVDTLAEAPDGRPFYFLWRRIQHHVVRAEGPERIAGEWWRAPGQKTRDYYRVEDREGRRFWVFRQGLYGETEAPRWFIHGLFA